LNKLAATHGFVPDLLFEKFDICLRNVILCPESAHIYVFAGGGKDIKNILEVFEEVRIYRVDQTDCLCSVAVLTSVPWTADCKIPYRTRNQRFSNWLSVENTDVT
jgi:hypothetical protein